jgi:ABC-type Fe3+ transport system substrate-binding protein
MVVKLFVSFGLCCLAVLAGASRAAEPPASLLQAKQQAETQGFVFLKHHDEIVAEAKKEGQFRFLLSEEPATINALIQAFKRRYPFIDAHGEETSGSDVGQRFMLELEAGQVKWDSGLIHLEWYSRYLNHSKKFDLLGMAGQQVLELPLPMIDPRSRRFVSATSDVTAIAYNRCTLKSLKVPDQWEDFLKPEFKGRKFVADLRPAIYPSIAAGAGEKWMLEYAKDLAAQEPVWIQGNTRAIAAVAAGEHALSHGINYGSAVVAAAKDPKGCLQVKIIEPILARINKPYFILDRAQNSFSGLLWLEFLATSEAQAILDRLGQSSGSILATGSESEKIVRGKKVWLRDWNVIHQSERLMKMTIEAFGFPKAGGLR